MVPVIGEIRSTKPDLQQTSDTTPLAHISGIIKKEDSTMTKKMTKAAATITAMFLMILVLAITASAATINKKTASLYQDATTQLSVSGTAAATWTTSNKAVATVTAKGAVKAVKAGTATITAKVGQNSYACKVSVKNLAINKTTANLYQDAAVQLTVNGANSVTWTTSNKAVATVTSKGAVKAVKAGTATITAKTGSRKFTCKVNVRDVTINKTTANLKEGSSAQLTITGSKNVSWTSSNQTIATVTSNGIVKGKKAGTATIIAKTGSRSFNCKVTVTANQAASTQAAAAKATLTEAAVYNKLIAMKASYPEGKRWTNDNFYAWKGGIYSGGYGCAGFAFLMSDTVFGTNKSTMHTDFTKIKAGDVLRVDNNTHSVIVLKVYSTYVEVAEGNYNSSIHWCRKITINELKATGTHVITRY